MFKNCQENGRFDLENVGQGQRIIYHYSRKISQTKLPKNIIDFVTNKKHEILIKSTFFNFFKILWGSNFLKYHNFVQKGSVPVPWLCFGKFWQQSDWPIFRLPGLTIFSLTPDP